MTMTDLTTPDQTRPGATPAPNPAMPTNEVAPRTAAVVAGVGYVVLFALAFFANFFVREDLVVGGDASATASNIAASEGLFRFGMLGFLTIFLVDIVVAWALYIVFRPINRDLSLVAAWSRLVYTVFLGVAIIFFFQALQLLDGGDGLAGSTAERSNALALVALETFNSTWLVGLAAFGLHLGFLGYVVLRSRFAPRALGYLLLVAGAAYVIDTIAHTLLADYADYETAFLVMVSVPAVIAEGWFGLWLLVRAWRRPTSA